MSRNVASFLAVLLSTPLWAAGGPLRWSFQADSIGHPPSGWKAHGGSAATVYHVQSDQAGHHYLAARSRASGVQLGTSVKVQSREYPILSWRWRVTELPRGGDETTLARMDSAAAVYVVFGSEIFPRIVKYIWSASVPAGTVLRHPESGRVSMIVVASGNRELGVWKNITRNLLDDYARAFGGEPGKIVALGVKTDSDSTSSSAAADYDDIVLSPAIERPKQNGEQP